MGQIISTLRCVRFEVTQYKIVECGLMCINLRTCSLTSLEPKHNNYTFIFSPAKFVKKRFFHMQLQK